MTSFVCAGAGFLLAVLWFDLMFDVQVRNDRGTGVAAEVLASISAYYWRVTTTARPMNRLVALAMIGTITAVVVQLAAGEVPMWLGLVSLVLVGAPIFIAGCHTVPAAVRLGRADDGLDQQRRLARSIWRDHLVCLTGIGLLLVLQLSAGR